MLLPPDDVKVRLISAYAAMRVGFGEELGERPLVLPTSDFFPDTFTGDAKSAGRLVARMQAHAGMADIPIRTSVGGGEAQQCSTTACGSCKPALPLEDGSQALIDTGDEWRLDLPPEALAHPVALTTRVARLLSTIFFMETDSGKLPRPVAPEVLVDLLGVGLGFGPLLMEGAHVYSKGCGGPSVARLTALGLPELSLCVALFCGRNPKRLRAARPSLGTTQRASLAEAEDWLRGNRELATQLEHAPELLIGGAFELEPPRAGWFAWLRREERGAPPALPPSAPRKTKAKAGPDDGLKALVEEVLAAPER